MSAILKAPLTVEFPFTRSLGPVQGAFLTGLRERVVLGVRTGDGRVLVPPVEYDPVTAEEIRDLVEVASTGTVTTWAWNHDPRRDQPLDTPFAWVLVRLDGADTALLHALDVPGPEAVRTGMRVRVRWAEERSGAITDIACFEPHDGDAVEPAGHSGEFDDPVTGIVAPPASTTPTRPAEPRPVTSTPWAAAAPSVNAAPPAGRCTSRRGVPVRPAGWPRPNRWRSGRGGRSPRSA